MAYIGIGVGGGGALFVPVWVRTYVGPAPSFGLSLSFTTLLILPACSLCDTGAVTALVGAGLVANVGAGFVITIGPGVQPPDGPGVSIGVGGGLPANPANPFGPGLDITVDVDVTTGQVTLTIPKLSVGVTAYLAVRVTGTCTGCSRILPLQQQSVVRMRKLLSCLLRARNAIASAIQVLDGRPANPNGETIVINYGPMSEDRLPTQCR